MVITHLNFFSCSFVYDINTFPCLYWKYSYSALWEECGQTVETDLLSDVFNTEEHNQSFQVGYTLCGEWGSSLILAAWEIGISGSQALFQSVERNGHPQKKFQSLLLKYLAWFGMNYRSTLASLSTGERFRHLIWNNYGQGLEADTT